MSNILFSIISNLWLNKIYIVRTRGGENRSQPDTTLSHVTNYQTLNITKPAFHNEKNFLGWLASSLCGFFIPSIYHSFRFLPAFFNFRLGCRTYNALSLLENTLKGDCAIPKKRLGYYLKVTIPAPYDPNVPISLYLCPVCQQTHVYAEEARLCCRSRKPVSLAVINSLEALYSHPPVPQPPHMPTPRLKKENGEGTGYKDRWGHWRRGKKLTTAQKKSDYTRAMLAIHRACSATVISHLEALYPTPTPEYRETTALQKLAYAFRLGSWDAVRSIFLKTIEEIESKKETI